MSNRRSSRTAYPSACITACIAALALGSCAGTPGEAGTPFADAPAWDRAEVLARTEPVAQSFTSALQAQLKAAMESGGPVQAIEVCRQVAPAIAAMESRRSGAEVSRVSARNRNPAGALTEELAPFYAELAAAPMEDGRPASRVWLSSGDGDGDGDGDGAGPRIKVLRAIPMQAQPCAACHGTNIAPEVAQRIAALYPGDTATGFVPGELRGALLVSWPAEAFAAE